MAELVTSRGVLVFRIGVLVTALALIYGVVLVPLRCLHAIVSIDQRTRSVLSGKSIFQKTRTANLNLAELEAACGGCQADVDVFLLRAFNLQLLGLQEEALRELEKGLRIDNRPELYMRRGEIFLETGRLDAAIREFVPVARFGPSLLDSLDTELRERVLAEVTKSQRHEPR